MTEPATLDVSAADLGPYVLAAMQEIGPNGNGDARAHRAAVMGVAVDLYLAATEAARDVPIRSFEVKGTLSIVGRNAGRTQIAVKTEQSQYGADQMWTEWEEPAEAERTHDWLRGLVGSTVIVVKRTFYERDHAGAIVVNGKGEKQTRTRMKPGSLRVVDANGQPAPTPTPAATSAEVPAAPVSVPAGFLDAAKAFQVLAERVGRERAMAHWGKRPVVGHIDQGDARAAFEAAGAVQ